MILSACNCDTFENCCCPKNKKFPMPEQNFLTDPRNAQKMVTSSVDNENLKDLQPRELRKSNLKKFD